MLERKGTLYSFSLLEKYYYLKLLMSVLFNWVAGWLLMFLMFVLCTIQVSNAKPCCIFIAKSFTFYINLQLRQNHGRFSCW